MAPGNDSLLQEGEDILPEEEDSGAPAERMRITVDSRQEPLRIDRFLMNRVEGATRNKVQQALEHGHILVNNAIVKANYKIKPGDSIIVFDTRPPEMGEIIPQDIPLTVIYEDEHLMVIDKPAGLVVHPGSGNPDGTLVNGLAYYLGTEGDTALPRIGLVHRIDKDTTGLVVIAKTGEAMSRLAAQFKAHTVHRRYIAIAWGDFEEASGTVRAHVGRHLRFRKIMAAYPEGDHGKEAVTHYTVLERFGYVTLLQLQLETGRTHQIRVHLQSTGHPLFNDSTYGGDRIVKGTVFQKYRQFIDNCFEIMPRHALHAKELGFTHPATGEILRFSSGLPADMSDVLEKWRTYTRSSPRV